MKGIRQLVEIYQWYWMVKSHAQQRLAWEDAEQARFARERAEAMADMQMRAMLEANPSGQLGHAKLDDDDALKNSGLL